MRRIKSRLSVGTDSSTQVTIKRVIKNFERTNLEKKCVRIGEKPDYGKSTCSRNVVNK